jgi:predicted component of type VI protein secretion system
MECVFRPVLSAITAGTVAVSLGQFINRHKQEVDHTRFVLAPCFALLLFTVTALLRRRYSGAVKSERQVGFALTLCRLGSDAVLGSVHG